MKNIVLLIFLLIVITNPDYAQSGWNWQHPWPQGNELNAIQMDGSAGWAVGVMGTVMKTTNEGYNWEIVDVGTMETLNGVTRNTNGEIWIAGDNGIIIFSDDLGVNWTNYTGVTSENINSVSFVYGACTWMCGDNNVVLRTTDSGLNWDVFNPGYMLNLNSIDHFDCNNAWAVGDDGLIISTTDGGTSWTTHNSSTSYDLYSIDLVEFGYYRACGQGGIIIHSTDEGATWQIENQYPIDALFNVDTKGIEASAYAVGTQGTILETTDYGVSWTPKTVDYNPNFNDVAWQALFHNIYVVGYYGVVYKNSGVGTEFELLDGGTRHWIQSLYFLDDNSGWAVGGDLFFGTNEGVILKTTDGGLNWDEQSTPLLLNDVDFANENEGWAVGKNGTIRHTINGGETWASQSGPVSSDLNSLCFIDENYGWAVGDYGEIINTTNGGSTWSGQTNPASGNLWGVSFVDENHGWAAGDFATILCTTDGGQSWLEQDANASQSFRFTSVQFINKNNGWISAIYGRIFRTTDGGENWQEIETADMETLMSVHFIDQNNGWAAGEYGTIVRSSDGGLTWEYQSSGVAANTLTSVFFLDNAKGWVTGEGGTIIYTEDGGGEVSFNIFIKHDLSIPVPDPGQVSDVLTIDISPLRPADLSLTSVEVIIDSLIHTNVSDLILLLSHEQTTDTLFLQTGGAGSNFIGCRLSDAAVLSIDESNAPFTGTFKPHSPLSAFSGMDPNGDWILTIVDAVSGNSGTLKSWGLKLFFNVPTGIQSDYSNTPAEYLVFQNYPNPFNPGTTIRWHMPESEFVTLKIYDVLGREITTLVNEELNAGEHETIFNASALSSGIYFYQFKAGKYIKTKKMILIK